MSDTDHLKAMLTRAKELGRVAGLREACAAVRALELKYGPLTAHGVAAAAQAIEQRLARL